jgi:hypothetical protein
MISGGYYVKQNDTHGFAELCLTPEAAALAPEGLLQDPNTVAGWKAIIRQLEDQLSEGVSAPDAAAKQAAGLAEFALRVLKTPYATTPMRSRRRSLSGEDDGAAATGGPGTLEILQRLEDGLANLRGEIGIWAPAARYITLHGGVGELGSTVTALQQEVIGVAQGVITASAQAVDARDEARLVQAAVTALSGDASRAIANLRGEKAAAKTERVALESTVLTLSSAVTALMDHAGLGPAGGITESALEQRLKLHDEAVNGCLDSIRQEMKGGGITVGGVERGWCHRGRVPCRTGSWGSSVRHLPRTWSPWRNVPEWGFLRGPSRTQKSSPRARRYLQSQRTLRPSPLREKSPRATLRKQTTRQCQIISG